MQGLLIIKNISCNGAYNSIIGSNTVSVEHCGSMRQLTALGSSTMIFDYPIFILYSLPNATTNHKQ